MALDLRQERYLERFYPGLVAAVVALGQGEFVAEVPVVKRMGKGLRGVGLHLTYKFEDGHSLEIKISSRIRAGQQPYEPTELDLTPVDLSKWERYHYSLHYGPSFKDCYFRFDLEEPLGHHVHIQPNPREHVRSDRVEPNVQDLDPRKFVAMVAAFRSQNVYPVQRKRP